MDALRREAASCKIFTLVLFAYWTWTWILELSLWWKNGKEENGTIKNSIKKMEHYPHRRLRKTSALHRRIKELFCIMFKKNCAYVFCILWFCLPSLVGWTFIDEVKFGFSDVSRACKAYLLGWHVLLGKVLHCFSLWEQGFSKLFYLSPPPLPSLSRPWLEVLGLDLNPK